jgi:hypothetical protein
LRSNCLPAFLLALFAGTASAQIERSHESHVHGRSQIDLVYEAGSLHLEFVAPGMDLVGFEHAPANESEVARIAAVIATLQDSVSWLGFDPVGRCTVTSAKAHSHGFGGPGEASDNEHADDGHGYRGDHEDDAHEGHEREDDDAHSEFHISLSATCDAAPAALLISLHDRFPALELVRIDLVTETTQNRMDLTRGQTRVPIPD